MQAKKKKVRILRLLGKTILGLLIVLFGLLLILHIPFVQTYLSRQIPGYLSQRIGAKVELSKLGFSVLGCAQIQGLKVWDPYEQMILSLDTLDVEANFLDILSGDYFIKTIKLNGVYARLLQNEQKDLNIQFIIDAFSGEKKTKSNPSFQLVCHELILEDVDFAFQADKNDLSVSTRFDRFAGDRVRLDASPLKLNLDTVTIMHHDLDIFSRKQEELVREAINEDTSKSLSLNLKIGFGIGVDHLVLQENAFSFHRDTVEETTKFNPNHIDCDQVGLEASDVLLHNDTLNFHLDQLTADMPGFSLEKGSVGFVMNHHEVGVSALDLSFAQSHLNAELDISKEAQGSERPDIKLSSQGEIWPLDITYFLPDTIEAMVDPKAAVTYTVSSNTVEPGIESINVNLTTSNSQLQAAGSLKDVLDVDNIAWENLDLETAIGSHFRRPLQMMTGQDNLPPGLIAVQMHTSGNRNQLDLEGIVNSSWGEVAVDGNIVQKNKGIGINVHLAGSKIRLAEYLNYPWLGPADLTLDAEGDIGHTPNLNLKGLITEIEISNKPITQIEVDGSWKADSLIGVVSISDSNYVSQIALDGDLGKPMRFTSDLNFEDFRLGYLLSIDSALVVEGDFSVDLAIDGSAMKGQLSGDTLSIINGLHHYALDSLFASVSVAEDSSFLVYQADDGFIDVAADFDLREMEDAMATIKRLLWKGAEFQKNSKKAHAFKLQTRLDDPGILLLAGIYIDTFSSIHIDAQWDGAKQQLDLNANTGLVSLSGISYDTLDANINALGTNINSGIFADNLYYNALELGDLTFDMVTGADTSNANIRLTYDSTKVLSLDSRLYMYQDSVAIYPEDLVLYDEQYALSFEKPLLVSRGNMVMHKLGIAHEDMHLSLDGDLNQFDLEFVNLDLTRLDPILFPDSVVINDGRLNGFASFIRGEKLDLQAKAEELILLNANPLTINIHAQTNGEQIPFEFDLTNGGSDIEVKGDYDLDLEALNASLVLDIDSMEMFHFFYRKLLHEVEGAIRGEGEIKGPLTQPDFEGSLSFDNVYFTTKNPKLTFRVDDDNVRFSNAGLALDDFIIYDNLDNPLHVSGEIINDNYQAVSYDLNIQTDHYALINRPPEATEALKGLLMLQTDINLKGNEKDTYVTADFLIKDTTRLVLTLPDKQNQLLNTEGIIEFVDPELLQDTSLLVHSESAYDSIIASLPDFTLRSRVTIEDEAELLINIDPQSGDYFKVAGSANLDLEYDRTGNPVLNGTYVVTDGVYSLSFYDLVKKDFDLEKGSSISWNGSPEDGTLDIRAAYAIQSNSIGLVGHEVGENEKYIYKKSLPYEVGINIGGTVSKPNISFSLDLSDEDKITYPALANKLSRLKQPEFQSELNKQVFGLLVLGSFIPDASGSGSGQSDIATTALYNSVNSLLAGQLNNFANQYVKGVNIDVGIQSYSDYATGGGKTKTSMDFHVSKSILDDRLVFEIGGDFDISPDQSGGNQGKSYRGDMAIIYDLTGRGDKQLKLFNKESYDIIYQDIRNTGISLIFIREFDKGEIKAKKGK